LGLGNGCGLEHAAARHTHTQPSTAARANKRFTNLGPALGTVRPAKAGASGRQRPYVPGRQRDLPPATRSRVIATPADAPIDEDKRADTQTRVMAKPTGRKPHISANAVAALECVPVMNAPSSS
jgi:hypothetical protein